MFFLKYFVFVPGYYPCHRRGRSLFKPDPKAKPKR